MSAMVQQTPVALRAPTQQHQEQHHAKKTDDAALATYLTSKLRLDQQASTQCLIEQAGVITPYGSQGYF